MPPPRPIPHPPAPHIFLLLSLLLLFLLHYPLLTHAFKLPPLGSQRPSPPTPPSNQSPTPKVFVAGATGRVGQLVVHNLVERGYQVVALARDPTGASAKALAKIQPPPEKPTGRVTVTKGDLTELPSLLTPLRGCVACISVAGASRVTNPFTDISHFLLSHTPGLASTANYPKTHPHSVNYQGTLNLLHAAKQAGVPKFIRVTGLSVGYHAFNPIAILLNLVISFTIRWQLAGERAIRASGIDYTVIRPGALTDAEAAPEELVVAGDGVGVKVGRVSREDVAGLCVAALESAKASNATFSVAGRKKKKGKEGGREGERGGEKAVLAAVAGAGASSSSSNDNKNKPRSMNDDPLWPYKILLRREGRPDLTPLKPKLHRLAVLVFVTAASACLTGLVAGLWQAGAVILNKVDEFRRRQGGGAGTGAMLWQKGKKSVAAVMVRGRGPAVSPSRSPGWDE